MLYIQEVQSNKFETRSGFGNHKMRFKICKTRHAFGARNMGLKFVPRNRVATETGPRFCPPTACPVFIFCGHLEVSALGDRRLEHVGMFCETKDRKEQVLVRRCL